MTNWQDEQEWKITQPQGFAGAVFIHTGEFDVNHHIAVCYGFADLALERAQHIVDLHNREVSG